MANFGEMKLPNITEDKLDDAKERRQILNYLAMLDEKLRYMFQNIDPEENYSEGAFENYIKTQENITSLQVEDGKISALVASQDGKISLLEVDLSGLRSTVEDPETGLSQVVQTANSLKSTVSNMDEQISSVEQTADKIEWIVQGDSKATFTLASRFASLVAEEVDITGLVKITDLAGEGKTEINGANITTGKIDAQRIRLGGMMDVYTEEDGGSVGGEIGYGRGNDGSGTTNGIKMAADDDSYIIVTGNGARMTDGRYAVYCTSKGVTLAGDYDFRAATNFYCTSNGAASLGTSSYKWDTVFASTGTINTSDRREKKDIGYDLSVYEDLFGKLRPTEYRMKDGKRLHIGFIAQDIEESMEECGIDSGAFAGFIKSPVYEKELENGEEDRDSDIIDYRYGLRYSEFIALNTHMIQKLQKEVAELKEEIAELRKGR